MGAVGLRDLNLTTYPWDEERMEPDVDAACKTIREVNPSGLVRTIGVPVSHAVAGNGRAAKEVGASVMYDGVTSRFDRRRTVPRSSSKAPI